MTFPPRSHVRRLLGPLSCVALCFVGFEARAEVADSDYKAADVELNAAYQGCLQAFPAQSRETLRIAQRAWLVFKEKDSAAAAYIGRRAGVTRDDLDREALKEVAARTNQLKAFFILPNQDLQSCRQEWREAERELTIAYQTAMAGLLLEEQIKLRDAERAWIDYNERNSAAHFGDPSGCGSVWAQVVAVRRRTGQLRDFYANAVATARAKTPGVSTLPASTTSTASSSQSPPIAPAASETAQTETEIRRAFANLHDDHQKHNCGDAIDWLYPRREELKDALVDELYRTDPQGAASIMFILFNTKSFTPDDRFKRLVMQQRPVRESRGIPTERFDVPLTQHGPDGDGSKITGRWKYIDTHFDIFEPLLTAQIGTTKDSWILWATAWLFKQRGTFETKVDLFTPEVLDVAATNLANDEVRWNGSASIRFFLIMGERSVPTLRRAAESTDSQTRYFARATLDALKGNRQAFGYLASQINLNETLFGRYVMDPPWMFGLADQYIGREAYP